MHLSHEPDPILQLFQTPEMNDAVPVVNDSNTDTRLDRFFEKEIVSLIRYAVKNHIIGRASIMSNIDDSKLEDNAFIHLLAHDLGFFKIGCRL